MLVFTICLGVALLLVLILTRRAPQVPDKYRGFSLEALEPRIAPAALNATFKGGVLTIAGDSEANLVGIFQTDGAIEVLDGLASLGVFENVRDITVKIQGGANMLAKLSDGGIRGNLKVTASGESNLTLDAGSRIGGHVSYIGDSANQRLVLDPNVSIGKSLAFNGKTGVDSMVIGAAVRVAGNATFTAVESANFNTDVVVTVGGNLQFKNASTFLPVDILTRNAPGDVGLNVAGKTSYSGGSGNDNVLLLGTFGGNVSFVDKTGNNVLLIGVASTIRGSLSATTGSGNDSIALQGGRVDGNLTVKLGDGSNAFFYGSGSPVTVGGNVLITGGRGDDTVRTFGGRLAVGKNMTVNVGDGANSIACSMEMTRGKLVVNTGAGQDQVAFDGSAPNTDLRINLGAGADVLAGTLLRNTKSGIYNGGDGIDRFLENTLTGNPLQIISFENFT